MKRHEFALLLTVIVACLGVLWQASAQGRDGKELPAAEVAALTQALGGEERYLTHISTDKPIYRPGETVYARGVMLHQQSGKPQPQQVNGSVEIIGPKGDVVAAGQAMSEDSVLAFGWTIPESTAGGEYKVKFSHPWTGDAPAERKFDIRAYRAPRLRSQIKFLRDGYGPADEVAATLNVTRAEGGVPAGAKVQIVARIDGEEAYRGESKVDEHGRCVARFKLPAEIARGEGTLAMVIEDGGVVETASKTIPILLQTVDLTLYPEGGDLVAGVTNRVYFAALTPAKKPADLAGVVMNSKGVEVAKFKSEHEGRGRFSLTPQVGEKYTLRITEPTGIKSTYELPVAKASGVAMSTSSNMFGEKVQIQLASPQAQKVVLTLSKRDKQLAKREVALAAGKPTRVEFAAEQSGALIATVRDAAGKPLAERLVFRKPDGGVQIAIAADSPQYVPGGKAKLKIVTTDASGKPTSAVVGIAATDDSVLEMIDKRDQAPRLPVMALLEQDVQELADAHIYLNPEEERGPLAVDLLLGTQGWRRFAFIDTTKFLKDHGDAGRRVLAMRVVTAREVAKLAEQRRRGGELFDLEVLQKADAKNELGAPVEEAAVEPSAADPAEAPPAVDELKEALEGQQAAQADDAIFRDLDVAVAGARAPEPIRNDFVAIRVYAHAARPDRQPGERSDFTETLYWNAGLKTDEQGIANIEFDLSDAVTSFRVTADAHDASGALGSASTAIESVEPFYMEPKLPLEVTQGDYILAPVGIVNATATPLEGTMTIDAGNLPLDKFAPVALSLPANERGRQMVKLPIGKFSGTANLTLSASASGFADKVTRGLSVKPFGFPVERGQGGLIDAGQTVTYEITIPKSVVAGSVTLKAVVYPTPLASMNEALQRLIQDPSGCFEQTSSTTYPLVMAQQYFTSHQGVDPSLIERSADSLEKGYQRLIGFECKGGGYEWFGADPGHDALTAYGLMEFTDMAKVRHIDTQMLERTRKWLLSQRDGKGNYPRKTHTYHVWVPETEIANTYNTWGLLSAGVKDDLSIEVKWIREQAEKTENAYVMALAANVFVLAGDKEGEEHMLDKLAGKQRADGSLAGATMSVVGSTGEALEIETTALAVMAWLNNKHYVEQVEKSIKYLAENCKAGRFGSTQSTVLALKAIVAYDQSRAKPKANGSLQLVVDGQKVGEPVAFTPETEGAIELPAFAKLLTPGKHNVQMVMDGGSQMPLSVAVNYFNEQPDSSEKCKVTLETSLSDQTITEGEMTEARVRVVNRTNETIPTPLAIVGIPGGLEVRHDQLKELVKSGKIAAYEVLGRDLVLYWRALQGEEAIDLRIDLTAAIPGKYTGPASRAYLYYTDEDKVWEDGLVATITPRK